MSSFAANVAMKTVVILFCIVGSLAIGRAKSKRVEEVGHDFNNEDIYSEEIKSVDVAHRTFLLPNMVMKDGVMFAIEGYFKNNKIVRFQIWRPTDFWMKDYKLISEISLTPRVINKLEEFYIKDMSDASCLRVKAGDRLGVVQEGSHTIPYIFSYSSKIPQSLIFVPGTSNRSRSGSTKLEPQIGETVEFEQIALPYLFLVSVFIDTDKATYAGQTKPICPVNLRIPSDFPATTTTPKPTLSPITVVGPVGPPGARGVKGATGAQGPSGVCSPNDCSQQGQGIRLGQSQQPKDTKEWWEDSHLMMGLLVWLVVLSITNLCLIAAMCCGCRYAFKRGLGGSRSSVNENVRETVREYNYRGGRGARASTSSTTNFANMGFTSDEAGAVYSNNLNATKGV